MRVRTRSMLIDLGVICWQWANPLPKTFLRTINGPRGTLDGLALAAVLISLPWD